MSRNVDMDCENFTFSSCSGTSALYFATTRILSYGANSFRRAIFENNAAWWWWLRDRISFA